MASVVAYRGIIGDAGIVAAFDCLPHPPTKTAFPYPSATHGACRQGGATRISATGLMRIFPGVDGLISASTAAMTCSLVGVVTWYLPRNRNEGRRSRPQIPEYSRRAVASSQCRGMASANFAHRGRSYRARSRGTLRHCGAPRTTHANDETTAIEHKGAKARNRGE